MIKLHSLPASLKVLITAFCLSIAMGYGVACLQIFSRTGFSVQDAARHYHGGLTEQEQEIYTPPSFNTLLAVSHVHTFSQPVMLGLLGLIFALTYLPEGVKVLFILLSFMGSLGSNLAPWLIRYVSPHWTFLLPLTQLLVMGSFFLMLFVILYDVWGNPERDE